MCGGSVISYRIPVKIFEDYHTLQTYVVENNLAVVSEDIPLLVDLSVNENIALILEYHYKYSVKNATIYTNQLLKKCGYIELSNKRPFKLNKKDKFIIQCIRAYVSPKDKVAIIKPFSMLDRVEDLSYITKLADILDEKEMQIVDTAMHRYYKENKCLTIE